MSMRKQKSGGQAIVMVTLALFAMAGMMGLAVDLGWSFYVQKEAQTAADGAALAAVHGAWVVLGGSTGFMGCPTATKFGIKIDCVSNNTSCSLIGNNLNTYNGCLYAKSNGFNWDVANSRQTVTVQANVGSIKGGADPPTVSGVNNIGYWATVRATQTIPQLFSSMLNNTQGVVAAISTAAVVQETVPGSFYGMNRVGDCMAFGGGPLSSAGLKDCGVDIDVAGSGKPGTGCAAGLKVILCGPDGIMLSSACNGGATVSFKGCADPGSGTQHFAGQDKGPGLVASGTQIRIFGAGTVDNPSNFNPTPVNGASSSTIGDPFDGKAQPPIVASSAGACELSSGALPTLAPGQAYGPFQYYVKTPLGVVGAPITINNNVTFAANGICPGLQIGSPSSGTFPGYVFYGGLIIGGGTVNFGNGQYVLAGTTDSSSNARILQTTGGALNCSDCMFVTTDGVYTGPGSGGLNPPVALSGTTFYQASVELKNATLNLQGMAPGDATGTLSDYADILFWQDRRNSTAVYDPLAKTITPVMDPNTGVVDVTQQVANHVTNGSPEFQSDDGNGSSTMKGVIHQPRGAWFNYQPGTTSSNSSLQIFTGAFITRNNGSSGTISGGNARMNLLPIAAPVIVYKTALIQ